MVDMVDTAPAIPESAVHAAREVRTLVGRLRRRLREIHDSRELTPSQLSLIGRLGKDGDACASDLAAAERIRPQSASTTLAALAEQGLVQRRPDPHDGRRQLLSLTHAGREVFEDRRRVSEEWLARALDERFTEEERQQVIRALALLDRLTQP